MRPFLIKTSVFAIYFLQLSVCVSVRMLYLIHIFDGLRSVT